ncbi:MAG TPA: GNAT family N-acetyltransferase [Actinotalea sp.]|nr:GNAT family N-acetyltransferase [Actinotalea sp.]
MALFREPSDVSVRPATAQDEAPITRAQLRAWRASHAAVVGAATLDRLDAGAVAAQWASALTAPPSPDHRVLVACAGPRVVGVVAWAPVEGGVEVVALEVDPDHQRGGHGSRLLMACVDLARQSGAEHLSTWVLDDDPARERFLGSAGLGPDGTSRELGVSPGPDGSLRTVTERRWWAQL